LRNSFPAWGPGAMILPVRHMKGGSMEALATTRMSSKGQVVIPEDVRGRLKLVPGVQFVVVGEGDVVILKTITPPSMNRFDGLIRAARQQARATGMKRTDIGRALAKVRSRK
jgi:AbrB family looped-hinge helix DNA binding protein